ncbi:hypothetical protein [Rhodoplanes azumiensis]|uniref:Uncharacterized protein n=1 Tax=Rhodoplanes azumiensis TaxID=1897628 RepID=A0ABW5AJD1_9BRAD
MRASLVTLSMTVAFSLAAMSAGFGAPADDWSEDLRRCLVTKDIDGGRVVLAIDEGVVEIDVQRGTDSDAETYKVSFDGGAPIDTTPPNGATGLYAHRLGTLGTVTPVLSKAKRMTIAITAADKPPETITIAVGNGAKAMAFLKKCAAYWDRRNRKGR